MDFNKKNLSLKNLPSIRQMMAFISVYQLGHFSAAAEQLSLTQPAVSLLIKELETKLGVKLFDRATRNLKPTPIADEVLKYIVRSFNELGELNHLINSYKDCSYGVIRIAVTSTTAQTYLPIILSKFLSIHPKVEIKIVECSVFDLIKTISQNKSDIGLGVIDKDLPGYKSVSIFNDQVVAAFQKGTVELKDPISWDDLIHQNLILVKTGYGIRFDIDKILNKKNLVNQLKIKQEVSLLSTVLALAASGLGVGIVPLNVVKQHNYPNLDYVSIVDPVINRNVSLIYSAEKSLSPVENEFIKIISTTDFFGST